MANKVGRPSAFESVEQLQTLIDAYFEECDETGEYYTITGLADSLGVTRQTLLNYTEKEEFFVTIKKAKTKIERQFERNALKGAYNPTIAIFLMKNNFGYKDKVDVNVESVEEDAISKALRESVNNGN
jgi:hypothetical protein